MALEYVEKKRRCFTTYASPVEAKAANDSRLLRPKSVCGTRVSVTTECRRPDEVDAYKNCL